MELSKDKYLSPRISGEILDCSMPMTFDQYSNCGYNCLYCFSTFQRGIGNGKNDYFSKSNIKAVSVEQFKKLFAPEYNGQFSYIIKNRKPFQWGGLSDPFCTIEEKFGVGLEILKFLSEIKYPVSFSSKSDLLLRDKRYWDAFMANKENYHYKASIITLNEKIHPILEGNTPSPMRRFEVLRKLSEQGVNTTLRLRPFVIGISDLDCVKMVEIAADCGVKSVSTEFFCLENRANSLTKVKYNALSKLCESKVTEGVDWSVLWDFRKEYFDHRILGELSGWNGIRKDRMNSFMDTGQIGCEDDNYQCSFKVEFEGNKLVYER